VLPFLGAAEVLSETEGYLLTPNDEKSRIRVRKFVEPTKEVTLRCSTDTSQRFLTKVLNKHNFNLSGVDRIDSKNFRVTLSTARGKYINFFIFSG